jgi:hypothetical protein
MPDPPSRAEQLHDEHRRKVWEDLKSGSENFDKYLLTFSSGALGLSLTFIKDVVPLERAVWVPSLIASWVAFLLCILVTLISFRISIRALEKMVPYLNQFYLDGDVNAFNKHLESLWTRAVEWCANLGILFFVLGLIFTMMFVGANIRRVKRMSDETTQKIVTGDLGKAIKPVPMTPLNEGITSFDGLNSPDAGKLRSLPILPMTPINEQRIASPSTSDRFDEGMKPPAMTPVRPPAPTPQPSQPQSPKK